MKAEILDGLAEIKEKLDERAKELNAELVEVMNLWNGVCGMMNGYSPGSVRRLVGNGKHKPATAAKKVAVSPSPASPAAKSAKPGKSRNGKPTNGERLAALVESGKRLTPASVAKRLKIDANYACSLLRQLCKNGGVTNPERGVYAKASGE